MAGLICLGPSVIKIYLHPSNQTAATTSQQLLIFCVDFQFCNSFWRGSCQCHSLSSLPTSCFWSPTCTSLASLAWLSAPTVLLPSGRDAASEPLPSVLSQLLSVCSFLPFTFDEILERIEDPSMHQVHVKKRSSAVPR
jgi:hypothetical protein